MALNTTFVAGTTVITAAHMNGIQSAWTSYTPTWSGTTGNGTLTGKWQRLGKTVFYRIFLTWGSTTSHAAANQTFALPTATHADYTADMSVGGVGLAFDTSGAARNVVTTGWLTSTSVYVVNSSGTVLTNTAPWTWATGDKLSLEGCYEAA